MVLTNQPIGKKSLMTIVVGDETTRQSLQAIREDPWAPTSSWQLNTVPRVGGFGRHTVAPAVVPFDKVVFEGGAGGTVRLLQECDALTPLRLPIGVLHVQGVKANVLFFDPRPGREEPWTGELWIHDLRTNQHFTVKHNPADHQALGDFIKSYNPETATSGSSRSVFAGSSTRADGTRQSMSRHLQAPRLVAG